MKENISVTNKKKYLFAYFILGKSFKPEGKGFGFLGHLFTPANACNTLSKGYCVKKGTSSKLHRK